MAENKKIILSGGGSGGSVTPILAIAGKMAEEREIEKPDFIFIGTSFGPEKGMVSAFREIDIPFIAIPAGKWRRYFSLNNFFDFFKIASAFFKSLKIISDIKPSLIITSGSFASVPLVYAAAVKRVPVLVHQQDIRPGLANKLMAPFAQAITVSFEKSLVDYGPKAVLSGNPTLIPDELPWPEEIPETFFSGDQPLVFVTGGGTGASTLNDLIFNLRKILLGEVRIVHLTGRGKLPAEVSSDNNYIAFEFLDNRKVLALMKRADIVISRCGIGALTELVYFKKPSILIPMPETHQDDNAEIFKRAEAAAVLDQHNLSAEKLAENIIDLLHDHKKQEMFSRNIGRIMKREAAETIAGIAWEMIK